ncbi:hypothetical protein [Streptomyces sp. NPDC006552]|uniref:hypothetical protein n=1 Tax=Streptomyces sp. NPDC006552 TaxID=3157179 RepID=UPI0033BD7435
MIRKAAASVSVALTLLVAAPAVAWTASAPSAVQKDPVEVCKTLVELLKVLNPSTPAADLDKLCEPKSPSPSASPSASPSPSAPPLAPQ